MDETLQLLRPLLAGETVDFDGDHISVEAARMTPVPTEPIPIVVGGRSAAAIRRAGRFGDGWFGIWVSARRYGEAIGEMESIATDEGRGDIAWHNALNVWCGIGESADSERCLDHGVCCSRLQSDPL